MYGWLWRHLPGPTTMRILIAAVLLTVAVVASFRWFFPWLEDTLNLDNVTVGTAALTPRH